jgi:hypothetical protein
MKGAVAGTGGISARLVLPARQRHNCRGGGLADRQAAATLPFHFTGLA